MLINEYLHYFITAELIEAMGQCAYQRALCALAVALPFTAFCFGLFCIGFVFYGLWKAISR